LRFDAAIACSCATGLKYTAPQRQCGGIRLLKVLPFVAERYGAAGNVRATLQAAAHSSTMRSMPEFDTGKPARLHDSLNDITFRWDPELVDDWR
jgi:hypothetical protein